MNISTTRFGDINVDESTIVHMKGGILGFEHFKRYALLTHDVKIPFWWFQSVDDGSIAFVVINSFMVRADYEPVISDSDVELLKIESPEDVVLMSIVTISTDPFTITANLKAPIVINSKNRLARQVVIQEPDYPLRYSIADPEMLAEGDENIYISEIKKISSELAP